MSKFGTKTKLIAIFVTIVAFAGASGSLMAQSGSIRLMNPSFEDIPHKGTPGSSIKSWIDCGPHLFPAESPPDIHPGDFWEVVKPPSEGKTFLGLVARYNDTWESLSQSLSQAMESGVCYNFEVDLSQSDVYLSRTHRNHYTEESFTTPCVFRIWGGSSLCTRDELLGESPAIDHLQWKSYGFTFQPHKDYKFIAIEVFYKTPILIPYNGNVLVDNMSDLTIIPCPGETVESREIIRKSTKDLEPIIRKNAPQKNNILENQDFVQLKPDVSGDGDVQTEIEQKKIIKEVIPEQKLLKDLDGRTIRKGQTIKVDKLYFQQDSVKIENKSHEVLDEIYLFLAANPKVIVEIGGHTNGLPEHDYCDQLSTIRAQAVSKYLVDKGIDEGRLKYKGYGKRNPIASNKTRHGRFLNQRVEIKILSVNG